MSKKPPELPPGALAELDQTSAEADEKWMELVEILAKLAKEYGEYGAMAVMGKSLEDSAKHEVLVSMVLTGMRREMKRLPKGP